MTTKSLSIDNSSSEVFFSVKKLGFLTIKGTISGFKGTIAFDQSDLSNSFFDVCVSAKTITTGNPKRDEHLKSKDFFSIEEHSTICFKSSTIKSQNGQYIAIGKLSILNIIQEIEIPFQYQEGVFKGLFSLNRLDYSLGSKFPAFIVGKTIQVSINCKLIS